METKSEVRILSLFELFAQSGRAMTLTEVAESLHIPASSCFNLVRKVEQRGYLYAAKSRGALYPTRRLYDVAKKIFDNDVVTPTIRARMADLRDQVGETVCLAQRRDKEVVYLEVQESRHSIRFAIRVGDTRDLYANSMGKAILASLNKTERDRIVAGLNFRPLSPKTLSSRKALEADIEHGRKRGWYSNVGETAVDVLAAALPVLIGAECYGLSIVGPSNRMKPELDSHLKALHRAAAEISQKSQ